MIGVYFLLDCKKIVYVGKTTRFPTRINGHADKKFNRVRFMGCSLKKLPYYEKRWMDKFKPKYNLHKLHDFRLRKGQHKIVDFSNAARVTALAFARSKDWTFRTWQDKGKLYIKRTA